MAVDLRISPPSTTVATGRLRVVDSHTCGQPTRVIVEGMPEFEYATVAEARDRVQQSYDWVRRLAVFEPHGHRHLFGAALVRATHPDAVAGVVFMDAAGYHDMCGHATIGVATTLVETGRVHAPEGTSEFGLETPAGLIVVRVEVRDSRVEAATFVNQPAFFLETVRVQAPQGTVDVPVAYGGQWYAFVDATAFGLRVEPEQIGHLVAAAAEVRPMLVNAITAVDPHLGTPPSVTNVMWIGDRPPDADGRNMPVNVAGGFDRSPCGTGTCARLAVLYDRGELAVGDTYVNAGVLGTVYRGKVASTTSVGGTPAIIPEITGTAWTTGQAELWVRDDDPLATGFLL